MGQGRLLSDPSQLRDYYLLLAVIDEDLSDDYQRVLRENYAICHWLMPAKGTAHSEFLNLLGLEDHDKEFVLAYVQACDAQRLLQTLRSELDIDSAGKGIAFLLSLEASRSLRSLFSLAEHVEASSSPKETQGLRIRHDESDEELFKRATEVSDEGLYFHAHQVLFAIVNEENSDELIQIARSQGVYGGTVLEAHGRGIHPDESILRLAISPEKEILLLVVDEKKVDALMRAFYEQGGLKYPGHGIAFTLKVAALCGWSKYQEA
ncbi:MAG: P-II family nitrogen regulator [Eubacteriales bacterium]|nr:P-II family nitrogen regulator [Eubacteriales bacterium]